MNFLRSRSPSPDTAAASSANAPANLQQDPDVARVQRINVIMQALGVAPSRASTQIHSHPEAVHRLSGTDLHYLAQHADLLARHGDIKCDFKAFSLILWALLGKLDTRLDEAVMSLAAGDGAKNRGSAHAQINALYEVLYDSLVQSSRVIRILRAFEEPVAHGVSHEKLRIASDDVHLSVRLAEKLATVMKELIADQATDGNNGKSPSHPVSVVCSYHPRGQELLKACEQNISAIWVLLGAVVGRSDVDVIAVLRLFNDELQWQMSGLCVLSTESYCGAVALLAQSLVTRRADFDNGDEVAANLILNRVAKRPPFRWRVFKLLHYSVRLYRAMEKAELPYQRSTGLLLMFATLQRTLEGYLTTEGALRDATLSVPHDDEVSARALVTKRRNGVKATRKVLSKHLASLEQQQPESETAQSARDGASANSATKSVLSFGQLLALAMVTGMPEVDLTDADGLLQRAKATALADVSDTDEELLSPDLLRLLVAYAFTVPTSDDRVEHAPLSAKSCIALYHSIAKYFFQEQQYQESLTATGRVVFAPVVNPQCSHPVLRPYLLLQLLVRNVTEGTDTGASDSVEEAHHETGNAESTAEAEEQRSSEASPRIETTKVGETISDDTTAVAMLQLMKSTVDTLYAASDRMHESAIASHGVSANGATTPTSLFAAVPEQVNAVTALSTILLFFFLDAPAFLKRVPPRAALDVLARVFALRAVTPIARSATARQRKARQDVLNRMQRRLAYLPQHMCAADVQATLLERVVPLAQPAKVAHPNRLALALLEAYVRSLATSAAAFSLPDELLLAHWVNVALPCTTSKHSAALAVAGHDFLVAPFLAQKPISPLFVPTYLAIMVPTDTDALTDASVHRAAPTSKYGEPSMALVKRFASSVRAACQGLERCDGTALTAMLQDEHSPLSRFLTTNTAPPTTGSSTSSSPACATGSAGSRDVTFYARGNALKKLSPTNAVLLVVAALFDKLCMLWNMAPGYMRDAQQRFATYFSALVNLLQCTQTQVLQRVCASIEAMMVEHMRGSGAVQMEFLKYIGLVVDNVRGNSKKGVTEWFLRLSEKMHQETRRVPSKL